MLSADIFITDFNKSVGKTNCQDKELTNYACIAINSYAYG